MRKKMRHLTLMEIMIVIVLIGLIGGVIAYNMRGSLEEGKVFKTRQGGAQVYNILMLEVAKGANIDTVADQWQRYIKNSPLVNKPEDLVTDGWGNVYDVKKSPDGNDLEVKSDRYIAYQQAHGDDKETFLR